MDRLVEVWDEHYRNAGDDSVIKDRNFFQMEVRAIANQVHAAGRETSHAPLRILELGSGTGFLAQFVVQSLRAELTRAVCFTGVDFSEVAVAKAVERNLPGSTFVAADFFQFLEGTAESFDVVVTQRSIMAILEPARQLRLLELLRDRLARAGLAVFSEGSKAGLANLTRMRESLGIKEPFEKVWHSLYLDEEMVRSVFPQLEVREFCSTYWLITRVVYPFFEQPKHNTKLHDFAASLDQSGPYGLVKMFVARK